MAESSQDVLQGEMYRACHGLSDIVYLIGDDKTLCEAARQKGAQLQMTWPSSDGGGFQAVTALMDLEDGEQDVLVVAFRGTAGGPEWAEYVPKAFGDNFVSLYGGADRVVWAVWMETLKKMWTTQAGTGPAHTMMDAICGHLSGGKKVWLTGHSKGAAVATTAAAHLLCGPSGPLLGAQQLSNLAIVTISSPLVFKTCFAKVYDEALRRFGVTHLRVQHPSDIVPGLPFGGGFAHVGTEVVESAPQSSSGAGQMEDMLSTGGGGATAALARGVSFMIRAGLAHTLDANIGSPAGFTPDVQVGRSVPDRSNPWAHRCVSAVTVILVGKSGAGKSTLGNKLLNAGLGPDEAKSYFREGGGAAGVTHDVEEHVSADKRVKVIDTPGIPDPDASNTIAYFNTIVEKIRAEDTVNLLIFVVKKDRTDEKQFKHYRVLLKQLNLIPCQKLLVCRQSEYAHRPNAQAKEKKRLEGQAFVSEILDRSGMDMPFMLHLDGTSEAADVSLDRIADFARLCPRVCLGGCPSLRTYPELKSVVRKLASRNDRLKVLEKEVVVLRRAVKHKQWWLSISNHCSMFAEAVLNDFGKAIAMPAVTYSERTTEIAVQRLANVEAELRNGSVDQEMLRERKEELDELEDLGRSHGVR